MTSFIVHISFYNFPVKIDASVQFKRTKHDIVNVQKSMFHAKEKQIFIGKPPVFL